jgi:hypothetical protein
MKESIQSIKILELKILLIDADLINEIAHKTPSSKSEACVHGIARFKYVTFCEENERTAQSELHLHGRQVLSAVREKFIARRLAIIRFFGV